VNVGRGRSVQTTSGALAKILPGYLSIPPVAFVDAISGTRRAAGHPKGAPSMSMTLTAPTSSLRRATVAAGAAGAATTTAVAAVLRAAGDHLAVSGQVPLAAFAQFVFAGAVAGGLLVALFNRRSAAPRRRFLQTAAALTALSCVPALVAGDGFASKIGLAATHLVAAAIIVPVLAHHTTD